jgi:hypothetical protein
MGTDEIKVKERERHRLYRANNQEKTTAYRKKRYAEHKEEEKQYRLTHPELYQKAREKWKRANPEKLRELRNAYAKRNHLKQNARLMAKRYIPLGSNCELCPEDDIRKATDRHHPDYAYPLIVVMTCRECHEWIDKTGESL